MFTRELRQAGSVALGCHGHHNYNDQVTSVQNRAVCCSVSVLFMFSASVGGQELAAPQPDVVSPHVLKAGTEVHLRLLETIASNTHKHGDRFELEVMDPVVLDGAIVIPGGAKAAGEVVHAAKSGFGGKAGELILATRSVSLADRTIRLRSFSAGSGDDRVNLALGLSYVLVGLFVTGKEISIPACSDVYAKVAEDTEVFSALVADPGAVRSELSVPVNTSMEIENNESSQR